MATTTAFLLCLGATTVGGVFLAFSTFVMKSIGTQPPAHGIQTMQRINVDVLTPWFMVVFLGTALLSVVAIAVAALAWPSDGAGFLLAAGLLYTLGSFGVTIRCNVPMNDRLAQLDARAAEAEAYWAVYVRAWTRWNHVRTLASIAAGASALGAVVVG